MKKLTYIAEKKESFKVLNRGLMIEECEALPEGRYKVTIEKYHPKATHAQFKYLYGIVYPMFLQAANECGYEFANVDELDTWCKAQWANKRIINRENGTEVFIPQSKSEFKTVDELVWANILRDYCAEYFGVHIPDPKK